MLGIRDRLQCQPNREKSLTEEWNWISWKHVRSLGNGDYARQMTSESIYSIGMGGRETLEEDRRSAARTAYPDFVRCTRTKRSMCSRTVTDRKGTA
jgi:hypothetical protein